MTMTSQKQKARNCLRALVFLGGASLMKPQFTEKLFKIRLLDVVCSVLLAKKVGHQVGHLPRPLDI